MGTMRPFKAVHGVAKLEAFGVGVILVYTAIDVRYYKRPEQAILSRDTESYIPEPSSGMLLPLL